ncbi:MAG: hypothetical protein LBR70_00595 [Lactobacillaceae bacterium]|jgi:hypothetical protein|nr:hypothetical protein [Lactobacillaceae bacterium]
MKTLFTLFAFFCFAHSAFATDFIEGMEDVPMMSGLMQTESDSIAFGNEESRFIETYLSGDFSFSEVEDFYLETLPQLGWSFESRKQNALSFKRDKDVIDIVREEASPLLVRITLKSRE